METQKEVVPYVSDRAQGKAPSKGLKLTTVETRKEAVPFILGPTAKPPPAHSPRAASIATTALATRSARMSETIIDMLFSIITSTFFSKHVYDLNKFTLAWWISMLPSDSCGGCATRGHVRMRNFIQAKDTPRWAARGRWQCEQLQLEATTRG